MLYAHFMTMVNTNINILELLFDIYDFFRKKYLRQPSIDFNL
jgi:hypothetical protein